MYGYQNPLEFDWALIPPCLYMMERGILIDQKEREGFITYNRERWTELQEGLDTLAGREVNVQSNPQMKSLLYDELGLPVRKKDKRVTCDEDAIRALMGWTTDKITQMKSARGEKKWGDVLDMLKLVLGVREVRKLLSTYLEVDYDDDGRARTTLRIAGAESFRFASSKTAWGTGTNMQTIPGVLRSMFIADPGYEMAELDLNRGESWVYAHLAADPLMMRIHQEQGDFHIITACAISEAFGVPIREDEWDTFAAEQPERAYRLRYLGKKTNHASAYRMGPDRFVQVVNAEADDTGITISLRQAKLAQKLWLGRYPFVRSWWAGIDNALSNHPHQLTTPYGRVRTFYDVRYPLNSHTQKDATSWVPQSTSVDYMNGGMLRVFNEIVKPGKWGTELLHQNHDSILIQYKKENRDLVLPAVAKRLLSTLEINGYEVTIPVEASYGPSWGEQTVYPLAA